MNIRNGEVRTIRGKNGSTECQTQSCWSGVGVKGRVRLDGCHEMKGEEIQKRKKSSEMQNVAKIREQSG